MAATTTTITQLPAAVTLNSADEIELDQTPHGVDSSTKATLAQLATFVVSALATRAVTGSYVIASGDYTVRVDATSGTATVTLPTAASNTGRIIVITKSDSSTNHVTYTGGTVNGQGDLTVRYDHVMLQCNGTSWDPIG